MTHMKRAADIQIDEQVIEDGGAYTVIEVTHYENSVDITFAETQNCGAAYYANDDPIEVF